MCSDWIRRSTNHSRAQLGVNCQLLLDCISRSTNHSRAHLDVKLLIGNSLTDEIFVQLKNWRGHLGVRVLGMCRVSCAGLGVPTTRTRTYGSGLYTAVQNRVNMVHGTFLAIWIFWKFGTTEVLTPVFYLPPGYGQPLDNVHLQHLNKFHCILQYMYLVSVFTSCSAFFLSMEGNIPWRQHCLWKTHENFPCVYFLFQTKLIFPCM